jgi:hypothetical protein
MEIDSDRIDEAVLALLYLGLHDREPHLERVRLGCPRSAAQERLHLRSGQQGQIGHLHRGRLREAERLFRELFAARD